MAPSAPATPAPTTVDSVECRFTCTDVEHDTDPQGSGEVRLTAITSSSDGWEAFTRFTPSGEIRLGLSETPPAMAFFEAGATYRVLFERVAGPPVDPVPAEP